MICSFVCPFLRRHRFRLILRIQFESIDLINALPLSPCRRENGANAARISRAGERHDANSRTRDVESSFFRYLVSN